MMTKHSIAVAAGISAALVVSSAAFGVANGVFRTHPADGIGHFRIVNAPGTTTSTSVARHETTSTTTRPMRTTTGPRSARETQEPRAPAVVTTGPTPTVHATVTTAPKRHRDSGNDAEPGEHDDD
jgi:hypothetical protein